MSESTREGEKQRSEREERRERGGEREREEKITSSFRKKLIKHHTKTPDIALGRKF